jgi:hypothetical protein
MKTAHLVFFVCALALTTATVAIAWGPNLGRASSIYSFAYNCSSSTASANLTAVVTNLTQPVGISFAILPTNSTPTMFIADQTGIIYMVNDLVNGTPMVFLNLSSFLIKPLTSTYDMRGLLGMAFHPRFQENGRFWVWYSIPNPTSLPSEPLSSQLALLDSFSSYESAGFCRSNLVDHVNKLEEYRVTFSSSGAMSVTAVRTLLMEAHPFYNHNGIQSLEFNALDNNLYLAIGDSGLMSDPLKAAQNDDKLAGKILRFDVDAIELEVFFGTISLASKTNLNSTLYFNSTTPLPVNVTAPSFNCTKVVRSFTELMGSCPFVAKHVTIVSKGLRNPSGLTFINQNQIPIGDMVSEPDNTLLEAITQFGIMVSNIGQVSADSLYWVRNLGSNLGWNFMEGTYCFDFASNNVCPNVTLSSMNVTNVFNISTISTAASPNITTEPSILVQLPIAEVSVVRNLTNGTQDAIIGGRWFTGNSSCVLNNKYVFARYGGELYWIDPIQLIQATFNMTDNFTAIPYPNMDTVDSLCALNGSEIDSSKLSSYRSKLLTINPITITSTPSSISPSVSPLSSSSSARSCLTSSPSPSSSVSQFFINCVQTTPDGSVMYLCVNSDEGPVSKTGAIWRVDLAPTSAI